LRMSKLKHLPANPMLTALPRSVRHVHFCWKSISTQNVIEPLN